MKKRNILGLFIVLGFAFMSFSVGVTSLSAGPAQEAQGNNDAAQQSRENPRDIVIKTYHLKYINPYEILNVAKFYLIDSTSVKNTITIRIYRYNIPKFEELLKRLDVEKKTVLFKVFTVIASKEKLEEEDEVIENKDLRMVLNELRNLWNFKSYKVEGPSFLSIKEDSGSNSFRLVSSVSFFNMLVLDVDVREEDPGERVVSIDQILLKWKLTGTNPEELTLIDTKEISLKEGGYLVAGISGYGFPYQGKAAKALILIINAEVK